MRALESFHLLRRSHRIDETYRASANRRDHPLSITKPSSKILNAEHRILSSVLALELLSRSSTLPSVALFKLRIASQEKIFRKVGSFLSHPTDYGVQNYSQCLCCLIANIKVFNNLKMVLILRLIRSRVDRGLHRAQISLHRPLIHTVGAGFASSMPAAPRRLRISNSRSLLVTPTILGLVT